MTRPGGWLSDLVPERGPGRVLFWASLINTTGTGLFLTSSALFFVKYTGMPPTRVGLGLTIAGLTGFFVGMPVGNYADRHGPRQVYMVTLTAEAVAMGALVLVRSFLVFVLLSSCTALAASASSAARGPLIRAFGGDQPVRMRSQLRSASNLGIALGGPLAGVAISADTRAGYALLILANAASFLLCAVIVSRLPVVPGVKSRHNASAWRGLHDRPFVVFVALYAVMMQQFPVLTLILPLWVSLHTRMPVWSIGALLPLNTLMVVLLQVRMSRRIDGPMSAARVMPRAGYALLVAFALMSALGAMPVWAAAVTLVVAVVVYTLGEIWFSTVSYELSFGLAPAEAQGQYLGLFSMGTGLGREVSQSFVTMLCLGLGVPGWIALGALMLVAAHAFVPTVTWALRAGAVAAQDSPAAA